MKKIRQLHPQKVKGSKTPTPEQTWKFLEDYAEFVHGQDQKTKLISLRVPANILETFKFTANRAGKKYQTQIVQLMREWCQKN